MSRDLTIYNDIVIPTRDFSISAVRSSGPGGQNVNKVASKVEVRFDIDKSLALEDAVKERLKKIAKNRLDSEGRLLVTSQKTREQSRNIEDALQKLKLLILRALYVPRVRKKTRPSQASNERRLAQKQRRARLKRLRTVSSDD